MAEGVGKCIYRHVKMDFSPRGRIKRGDVVYLKDQMNWEVSLVPNGKALGCSLISFKYRRWMWVLYCITQWERYSPVRYFFVQQA